MTCNTSTIKNNSAVSNDGNAENEGNTIHNNTKNQYGE